MIDTLHPASNTGIAAITDIDKLIAFITLLETKGIEYVLVGNAALLMIDKYQRPTTDDFAFVVAKEDMERVEEVEKESSDRNFGRYLYQGTRIDALYRNNPIFDYVMTNCLESTTIEGREITRATPEGIILLKLYALPSLYQQGQQIKAITYESDITGLLAQIDNIDTQTVFKVLSSELLPGQVNELGNILSDCQTRAKKQRFQ